MKSKAQAIVDDMLSEAYDEHVKSHERVRKWNAANDTYTKLCAVKRQSIETFNALGQTIAYERALAQAGLTRDDVSHTIRGADVSCAENYKPGLPLSQFRGLHQHVIGVETNDGRRVWFDDPIPPRHVS